VQDHRVGGDQLFALEAIDQVVGCRIEIEARELLSNEVEALHGAAIVVLVVADDQLFGHAFDVLGIAAEGFHFV
jgi:glutamate formiminotransferase